MTESQHVLLDRQGSLARITLNRPGAINALTLEMVRTVRAALVNWATDPSAATVLIDGAGERGLCAGGDIRAIWESLRGDGVLAAQFWEEEYALNFMIGSFAKPVVTVMDGITMGGGIGVGAHARHRIVTERSRLAMPETIIGFTPDAGGSFLLSRAPGAVGLRMALTGCPVGAADALACGLADHFVPAARLGELAALLTRMQPELAIAAVSAKAPAGMLASHRGWIDAAYSHATIEDIIGDLETRRAEPQAPLDLAALAQRSPTSLKVTLLSIRHAAGLPDLSACLAQELRLARILTHQPDFIEGVRAQIIDKDRKPAWSPSSLADVRPDLLTACFED